MKRARILACLLDAVVCAGCADAAALGLSAILWFGGPAGRAEVPWVWAAAALGGIGAFLSRDARGGRARRWLGLEAVRADGSLPGVAASIRRNLPLLIPGWNVLEVWPVLKDGDASRPADRKTGVRIRRTQ